MQKSSSAETESVLEKVRVSRFPDGRRIAAVTSQRLSALQSFALVRLDLVQAKLHAERYICR